MRLNRLEPGLKIQLFNKDFDVITNLGEGGFAEVWQVQEGGTGNNFALKILKESMFKNKGGLSSEGYKRFLREAETYIGLESHPNIVTVYAVDRIIGLQGIVMEYVADGTLKQWLSEGKINDWKTLLSIAIHIASGLSSIHKFGIIHRDLKPSNILVKVMPVSETKSLPVAQISDFGLIKFLWALPENKNLQPALVDEIVEKFTGSESFVGTIAYAAPEQLTRNFPIDKNSDLYSFGLVLCEMITLENPQQKLFDYFKSLKGNSEDLDGKFVDYIKDFIIKRRVDCPDPLISLILKCLNFSPNGRWKDEKLSGTFEYFDTVLKELKRIFHQKIGHVYNQVFDLHTESLDIEYNYKGVSLMNLGRIEKSILLFEKAVLINDNEIVNNNLGMAYFQIGKNDKALKYLEKAISINPSDPSNYTNRAIVLDAMGDFEKAISDCDKAIELGGEAIGHYNKGLILGKKGKYSEAKENFEIVIKLNPYDADAYNNIGMCILNSTLEGDPISFFDTTLSLDPYHIPAYGNKAQAILQMGRLDIALTVCQDGLKIDPFNKVLLKIKHDILGSNQEE